MGISAANVHWTMGTRERATKRWHHTGAMPDVLSGLIAEAAESAGAAILTTAGKKVKAVLASEAAKAKK